MDTPPFVLIADADDIVVQAAEPELRKYLAALGFRVDPLEPKKLSLTTSGDAQKADIFARLRDKEVCFARGREWSPAEVFEYLKEQGLLQGGFTEITWRSPEDWVLYENA
jgi:hypothetical protein